MVKSSLKLKIVQGAIIGIVYSCLLAIAYPLFGIKQPFVMHIFHAVFFGGIMGVFLPWLTDRHLQKLLDKNIIEISEDEQLQMESGATLKFKNYREGGKLILTDKRLAFKPNELNIKSMFVEIPLSEIIEIEKKKTLGFVNNAFIVKINSEDYKFFVYEKERDTWVSSIFSQKTISYNKI